MCRHPLQLCSNHYNRLHSAVSVFATCAATLPSWQPSPELFQTAVLAFAACVLVQVVQAPALSLTEMMSLNPMMALQMQGIQQASVS